MTALAFDLEGLVVIKRASRSSFELHVPLLRIAQGAKIALVGPSGSGKSTLLDALSLVSAPAEIGRFAFSPRAGESYDVVPLLKRRAVDRLAVIRRRAIGYVLQTGGLLPFLTVRGNIRLSRTLLGLPDDGTVETLARTLGIADHLDKKPAALSVGERQRVAIARALAHRPGIVIADEPTAALDPANAATAMQLFVAAAAEFGATTIVASHDVDRVLRFGLTPLRQRFLPPAGDGATRSLFEA